VEDVKRAFAAVGEPLRAIPIYPKTRVQFQKFPRGTCLSEPCQVPILTLAPQRSDGQFHHAVLVYETVAEAEEAVRGAPLESIIGRVEYRRVRNVAVVVAVDTPRKGAVKEALDDLFD
jgi:hypothetical protein